jgi:ribosomal protein S12 methylthiotransferase
VSRRPRVGVVSLGCAKNLVDTEVMLGHLDRAGASFVTEADDADVLVVNTCSFIDAAREESVRAILDAVELKRSGRLRRVVVAGCMVQRYPDELRESLPEVDAFVGLDELDRIAGAAGMPAAPRSDLPVLGAPRPSRRSTFLYGADTPRRLATPPWTAYVKIAEGCDHTCAFCAIPSFRGAFRSRAPGSVVEEARALASRGVREINLIAQDSSHYGRDRGDRRGLAGLLRALDAVEGLRWIRVHYLYPNTVTPALIEAMATLPRVVKYVDMPLQHADAAVLGRMRRGGTADSHLELLARFREAMPDAALRSTFIVGFPGETESEFEALLAFVREARFEHLGAFAYSHEEDTPAAGLADDVPADVKAERLARLLDLQQELAGERLERRVGTTSEVLVEGAHPETEHLLVGRLPSQAPDVDGKVLLNDGPPVPPGTFARVELTELAGYELVGRILDAA